MPDQLSGVVIVVLVLLLLSTIFSLLFLVSQGATSALRQYYPAPGPFDGPGWTVPYARIGAMTYKNIVRAAANPTGLHISIPGHQAIFIPWSDLTVVDDAGLVPSFFRPIVTLRARLAPGTPIGIHGKTAERLRERAGPAWPQKADAPPAARPYDSTAADDLKKLGSPWSRRDR